MSNHKTEFFLQELKRAAAERSITLQGDTIAIAIDAFHRACKIHGIPNDATIKVGAEGWIKKMLGEEV